MVNSRDRVQEVHRVAVALGSEVVHEPREFPQYHPGYYATFWLDPYGQMLEAVCHKTPLGEPQSCQESPASAASGDGRRCPL